MLLVSLSSPSPVVVPIVATATTHTIAINATRSAYSMSDAPRSPPDERRLRVVMALRTVVDLLDALGWKEEERALCRARPSN